MTEFTMNLLKGKQKFEIKYLDIWGVERKAFAFAPSQEEAKNMLNWYSKILEVKNV